MFIFNIKSIYRKYNLFKNSDINEKSKIFRYSNLVKLLRKYQKIISINTIGYSIEHRKIFKIQWGKGNIKILIWSQMHGDETTGTKSMFDIFNFFLNYETHEMVKFFEKNITIIYIPMLNPDGSEIFQRRNAIGIDLNRDAIRVESPEIKILFREIEKNNPKILFNLHDQRSIYNVDNKYFNPAILSFLSPSNKKNIINNVKKKSMGIIYEIYKEIKKILPNNIGSIGIYSEKYYPNATGDYLQEKGYPCILIEAGNYPGDAQKNIIRKYNTLSILFSFYFISSKKEKEIEKNYKLYYHIKQNKKIILDKIYRKVEINKNETKFLVDIGLMKSEFFNYKKMDVDYNFRIVDIGDLSNFFAYEDLSLKGKKFFGKNGENYPKIGEKETFMIQ
ncbi:M14 family zinc carboxypeptidase [Blattabacterium cuenoti]|uniref:M14 family zinc carboxypeptidase n=1 Tax=Blattabacterium cuenoti TaxID=1653831 RepID=UPI00163D2A37|nr:M14 family zinc carboxypeptidase [Blattabacterium cuenoti]